MRLVPQSALGAPFASTTAVDGFAAGDVALSERADIGCVLLAAATDPAGLYASIAMAAGIELPRVAGRIGVGTSRRAVWLSPRSWLVLCELDAEEDLVNRIAATFPDKRLHATYFADYLCWVTLSGPRSREILQDSAFVSLESAGLRLHHAKRTLVAGITAVIIHESEDAYLIGVERSRARYFADRLIDTARSSAPIPQR